MLLPLLPSLLLKVSLCAVELAFLSHPLPPWICTGREASWQVVLISSFRLWELTELEQQAALSSTSGALQNSLRSGNVLCAWGTHKIHLDPPASSDTCFCGTFSSLRQQGLHCPSTTVNLVGTTSLSHHPSVKLVTLSESTRSL